MRRVRLLIAMAALGSAALPAQIRTAGLDQLAEKAKESVDITLDPAMLQTAARFLAGANNGSKDKGADKIRTLLQNLKAIQVKSFEFAEKGQYRQEDLDPIRKQLQAPGWSKMLSTKEEHETSEIYAKSDGGKITGFAILAAEPKELTVVYIEGSIDLADLANLGGQFGIPAGLVPGAKSKQKGKDPGKASQ